MRQAERQTISYLRRQIKHADLLGADCLIKVEHNALDARLAAGVVAAGWFAGLKLAIRHDSSCSTQDGN